MLMYFLVQKRVQSSAADQPGSKLHRWARASATAKVVKNKLGMPLFVCYYLYLFTAVGVYCFGYLVTVVKCDKASKLLIVASC